jgi:hypothetical protein
MRCACWGFLFILGLTFTALPAQEPAPASSPAQSAHVLRVRTGLYAGMCVGYCAEETVVEPTSIRSITSASAHRWIHPDRKTKRKITQEEWQDLQRSIDAPALASFIGPVGCPGCGA